jgi:fatty-acyl-CoA synthase
MLGLMQQQSLLISSLVEFAEKHHGDSEVVSRRVEGDIHRSDWAQVARRSRQVANALDAQSVPQGARIATLA